MAGIETKSPNSADSDSMYNVEAMREYISNMSVILHN